MKYNKHVVPDFVDAESFIEHKVSILRDEFCIPLSDADIEYLKLYNTENDINAAVKTLLTKYWGD